MNIIAAKVNQLGNRLFTSAHIMASAQAHGQTVMNLSFGEYAEYFEGTCRDLFCRYPRRTTPAWLTNRTNRERLYRLVLRLANSLADGWLKGSTGRRLHVLRTGWQATYTRTDGTYDLHSEEFHRISRGMIFFQGPHFVDDIGIQQFKQQICEYFTPIQPIQARVTARMERLRQHADGVVGIHIRHGDYADFEGGRYFYSASIYAQHIRRMRDLLRGQRVKFLLCSDVAQNPEDFKGLEVEFAPGHMIEDLYLLAACDYIIGPPSTYNGWAGFFGNRKLYSIKDPGRAFQLSDFS